MRMRWRSETTGLLCEMNKSLLGAWCGYVAVGPEHPLYGVDYMDTPRIAVHGGLTFSGNLKGESLWWFGFDCAHYCDYVPGLPINSPEAVFRDSDYVRKEVEVLAHLLAKMK